VDRLRPALDQRTDLPFVFGHGGRDDKVGVDSSGPDAAIPARAVPVASEIGRQFGNDDVVAEPGGDHVVAARTAVVLPRLVRLHSAHLHAPVATIPEAGMPTRPGHPMTAQITRARAAMRATATST
jgi:hypothetical protein